MNIENDEKHYAFFLEILKALHLTPVSFFKKVANHSEYETMIYTWINQLYYENRSIDYSIQFIYRARYLIYCKGLETIILPKKKNNSEKNKEQPPSMLNLLKKTSIINKASQIF